MKQIPLRGIIGTAALAAVLAWPALAQDEPPADASEPPGDAAEAPAEGPAGESGDTGETPVAEVKPRPAEMMPLTPKSLLLDVVRADGQFVAVGDRGGIITSPDGSTWTQTPVPVRAALTAVHFPDPQHGWAVGHDAAIVATRDGGKSWALQNFEPELEKPFLDVLFVDANRGYAVGAYGLFYMTSDGGQTWTEPEAAAIREEELHFNSIIRLGNGDLFIAGESGMLGVSSDGENWQRLSSPYESTLFGALPVGDKGAIIFGLRGNVYTTTDVRGGKWTQLQTDSVASMFGGTLLPDGAAAMVGLNGVIMIADAAGSTRLLQSPAGTPLSAAIPVDGKLLAVGESGVQILALQ